MTILTLALLAAVTIPDTPAGRVFQSWLDAFNDGSRARIEQHYTKYSPDRMQAVPRMIDFRQQTGGFDLIRIISSTPLRLESIVKERAGDQHATAIMEVSDDATPHVLKMGLEAIDPPRDLAPSRLPVKEVLSALDAQAQAQLEKDAFSGAILVARSGSILFDKAYGLADRDAKTPNRTDTQFRLGSMNKMFTAVAALQLVEKGKLDLDAPLAKYIPDYPNKDLVAKVKVRHLLSHTGGTGDIFTPEYDQHRLEIREVKDYIGLFGSRGVEFEPGTRRAYSNYGFVLLGYLVERVSGMPYYDYVRRNIFEPLGMKSTDSLPEEQKVAQRSSGYMKVDGAWKSNSGTLPWRGSPAGGGYSTTGDLLRFAEGLLNGRLLKPETLAEATRQQLDGGRPPYGFGFGITEGGLGKCFGHNGGAPGMNGSLQICPDSHTVIAVLSNLDPPAAGRLSAFIENRISDK